MPFDILAECLPISIRGKFLLFIEYFWTLGSMTIPVLAYLTIGQGASWNVFVFICAIPCCIGTIGGMIYVPESIHWLASQGRTNEALDILKDAAIINGKDPNDIFTAIDGITPLKIKHEQSEDTSYAELLKPKWRKLTLLLWVLWFFLAFSYYGTLMIVTKVFEEDNDSDDDDSLSFDYLAIFISSTAEIFGTTMVILTVDKWGRVMSQIIFYCFGGFFLYLLCMFADTKATNTLLTIYSFMARIFTMASTCCTWVAAAELFGTEVRTTGHSSCSAVARVGGIIVPFIVYSNISFPHLGVIMLVVHYLVTIIVMQTPETQGKEMGKAHEEYHSSVSQHGSSSHEKNGNLKAIERSSNDNDDDKRTPLLSGIIDELASSVSEDSF